MVLDLSAFLSNILSCDLTLIYSNLKEIVR